MSISISSSEDEEESYSNMGAYLIELEGERQNEIERQVEMDQLEFVIQTSLLKLRKFFTTHKKQREEYERLLVQETLRLSAHRLAQLQLCSDGFGDAQVSDDSQSALLVFEMHNVIMEALRLVGLAHQLVVQVTAKPINATDNIPAQVVVTTVSRAHKKALGSPTAIKRPKCQQSAQGKIQHRYHEDSSKDHQGDLMQIMNFWTSATLTKDYL